MMTRDAKIGLLVGLAFILIVGILLSEHVTSATAPQQASLAQAGEHVREAVSAPVAARPAVAPVNIDPNPLPPTAVVTRDVIDSPQLPPTARIELGPAQNGQIKVIRIDTPEDSIASATEVRPISANESSAPMLAATNVAPAAGEHPLQDAARANGMEIVDVRTIPTAGDARRPELPPIANGSKVKEYVAQSGDSLGRIASRQLGANTPANRNAIIALNPSLQKDNNRILTGAKYLIPADAWSAAMGIDTAADISSSARRSEPLAASRQPSTPTVYTVISGDSLWKIAERECGSSSAVAQIKQLNADVLGDSETVKVGMKLKLPGRKAEG